MIFHIDITGVISRVALILIWVIYLDIGAYIETTHLYRMNFLYQYFSYESVCRQLSDEATMENAVDHLQFVSATRCNISAELEFSTSHFCDFLRHPQTINGISFLLIYRILGHGSLKLESEGSLSGLINRGTETNQEILDRLGLIVWE
jgi:hypothetical protein